MKSNEELAGQIPRTKEELEDIKESLSQVDTKATLDKAYKSNERIDLCRKMVKMFETEEFKEFWQTINTNLKAMVETSPKDIKGDPKLGRYDPMGQLVQLNIIQGGLEMLESQEIQKKIIEEMAKGEKINVDELENKLREINNA